MTIDAHDATNAETLILYIFRQDPSYIDEFSIGNYASYCVIRDTKCQTFTIPTQSNDRDITVTVPLSEVTNDGRIGYINLDACGVTSSTLIDDFNAGNSLHLAELTLSDVSGSCVDTPKIRAVN